MKRSPKELIAAASTFFLLLPVSMASAAAKEDALRGLDSSAGAQGAGLAKSDIPTLVGNIIFTMLSLAGIVMVVFFIYAGFLWMTAQGNEEQISKAKNIIKNCVIGLIIALSAYMVTSFVIDALIVGTGLENPSGT